MAGAFYDQRPKDLPDKTRQLKVSESYIIGIDISDNGDESVLTVSRLNGNKMTVVNTFTGEEAEWMYERLTNQKIGVVRA